MVRKKGQQILLISCQNRVPFPNRNLLAAVKSQSKIGFWIVHQM